MRTARTTCRSCSAAAAAARSSRAATSSTRRTTPSRASTSRCSAGWASRCPASPTARARLPAWPRRNKTDDLFRSGPVAAPFPGRYNAAPMFESLSESLGNVFRKLSGKGRLSEANIEEGLQEVRRALLAADVSFKIVKDFIDRVKVAAVGAEVLKTVNPTQMFISIVDKELTLLMGPVDHAIPPA